MSPFQNLLELLESAALSPLSNGITFYLPGSLHSQPHELRYLELFLRAKANASAIIRARGVRHTPIALIYFETHLDSLIWFWSVIAAGMIPCICGPLNGNASARKSNLVHLSGVLHQPLCITRDEYLHKFDCREMLSIETVESLQRYLPDACGSVPPFIGYSTSDAIAVLMLTSGSTGNSKAVTLKNGQVLQAVSAKSIYHRTTGEDVFLNFIGLDHVANFTEIHLHALSLGANQVHVEAADLFAEPLAFTDLISRHAVTYTFSPNFFLAKLERALSLQPGDSYSVDLSRLRALISGGEANPVETVSGLSRSLERYGARNNVIRPGFGMTETCAGSIYNLSSPEYDQENQLEFASLGRCIPGIRMRVVSDSDQLSILCDGEIGNLQVKGPIVTVGYYNNHKATREAFTADGWFKTGDRAFIAPGGMLVMTGRAKESIIINGIKHYPPELETAIEEAAIPGVADGYTVVFPYRQAASATEDICVAFHPTYCCNDAERRVQTSDTISKILTILIGTRPFEILPLDTTYLQKSSLGKLSRTKIATAFQAGEYDTIRKLNRDAIAISRQHIHQQLRPGRETEIAALISQTFNIPIETIGAKTSIMDLGISSIELIILKQRLQKRFQLSSDIPITRLITDPDLLGISETIRGLEVSFISNSNPPSAFHSFDPIVPLSRSGSKTPLFLIHPGVGEILVFVPLARYITDRPLYALRARGFESSERLFGSIAEAVDIYKRAILRTQPCGPYAIAGYSYGAMIAFELSKGLIADGHQVLFTGSFNLPPHIAFRMRQLDWPSVLLHLAYFVGILTERDAQLMMDYLHALPCRALVLEAVLSAADSNRLAELDLSSEKVELWADIAHHLQLMAREYEPHGKLVNGIDVFVADPLREVAPDRATWVRQHLRRWADHCETGDDVNGLRLHHVKGSHYTMLAEANVDSFCADLKLALRSRGL